MVNRGYLKKREVCFNLTLRFQMATPSHSAQYVCGALSLGSSAAYMPACEHVGWTVFGHFYHDHHHHHHHHHHQHHHPSALFTLVRHMDRNRLIKRELGPKSIFGLLSYLRTLRARFERI